jgi:hypothetical protein
MSKCQYNFHPIYILSLDDHNPWKTSLQHKILGDHSQEPNCTHGFNFIKKNQSPYQHVFELDTQNSPYKLITARCYLVQHKMIILLELILKFIHDHRASVEYCVEIAFWNLNQTYH